MYKTSEVWERPRRSWEYILQCTHAGCTLALPGSSGGQLFCPCHGSLFTVQGAVVQGPASASLHKFAASIDATNNQVDITNA